MKNIQNQNQQAADSEEYTPAMSDFPIRDSMHAIFETYGTKGIVDQLDTIIPLLLEHMHNQYAGMDLSKLYNSFYFLHQLRTAFKEIERKSHPYQGPAGNNLDFEPLRMLLVECGPPREIVESLVKTVKKLEAITPDTMERYYATQDLKALQEAIEKGIQ
jgi:hypothetical protein